MAEIGVFIDGEAVLRKANQFNFNSFDIEGGVMMESTFYNRYVTPNNYHILSEAGYTNFCNKVDVMVKSLDNTKISSEVADELFKAIDDSNSMRRLVYKDVYGQHVVKYLKEKTEIKKAEDVVTYSRLGTDISKAVESKLTKLDKKISFLKYQLDEQFAALPNNLVPATDTMQSVSKAFSDEYGIYRVFSMAQCFPTANLNKQFVFEAELKKSYEATGDSVICKAYNEAVFAYVQACTELMSVNVLKKGVDSSWNYKLDKEQYLAIFDNEELL